MARAQGADGGNDLQRVAANILVRRNQSRTAENGWSSSLRVARMNNSLP